LVVASYPQVAQLPLGESRPVTYSAQDGSALTGLLTLPPGREPQNLPLIVIPGSSAGFWSNASTESQSSPFSNGNFDWIGQFLAYRGYAVLYAGAREFKGLGDVAGMDELGTWVNLLQEDISSGIAHLADGGIVDRARVCILGRATSGYVALANAAFSPDRFACSVSITGYSELKPIVDNARRLVSLGLYDFTWRLIRNRRQYAPEELERFSPAMSASAFAGPVLLIDGEDRGWESQSERMAALLQRAGKAVKLVMLDEEMGALDSTASRVRVLREIDEFFEASIGR
jgi:dipeptidyl aminopeptidase/acylaminoacyl peptidase